MWNALEADQQGAWLATRADLPRLAASFEQLDHDMLESVGAWHPLYLADCLMKAEAVWREVIGRPLNPAECSYLADVAISASGDADVVTAALRETAVSTDRPNLKLVAAIAARMAGPNWEAVGAAKNLRLRPPEERPGRRFSRPDERIDKRRPIPVSELPEYQPYSQRNHI